MSNGNHSVSDSLTKYCGTLKIQMKNVHESVIGKPIWVVNLLYRERFKDHVIIQGMKTFEDGNQPSMDLLREMQNSAIAKFKKGEFDEQLDLYFNGLQQLELKAAPTAKCEVCGCQSDAIRNSPCGCLCQRCYDLAEDGGAI